MFFYNYSACVFLTNSCPCIWVPLSVATVGKACHRLYSCVLLHFDSCLNASTPRASPGRRPSTAASQVPRSTKAFVEMFFKLENGNKK